MQLLDRLAQLAETQPDHVALDDGTMQLSYAALWQDITRIAHTLAMRQVRRLGLEGGNSINWILHDLACLVAGVVNVPIPGFFSASQRHHLIETAGLDCLLDADTLHWQAVHNDTTALHPGTCKITFTSGSTGSPRGVCLSERNLDATTAALANALGNEQLHTHLCVLPLATLLENIAGVYLPLWLGATVQVRDATETGLQGSSRFDLFRFIATLNAVQPESLILVPQLLTALVIAAEKGMPLPGSLRLIAVGGGKVSLDILARAGKLGLPVYEGYGLSECSSVCCLNTPARHRAGTVGQPLPHVRLRVGAEGQIEIRSESQMLGYLGGASATHEWLQTGDLGEQDGDGHVRIHGRSKNLIITSWGRNISPEWVESELQAQLPIAQAAVFGDASEHLTAIICVRNGFTENAAHDAILRVNQRLPDYARINQTIISARPFDPSRNEITANGRPVRDVIAATFLATSQTTTVSRDSRTSFPARS